MTFYEAAVEVLKSAARPLHYKKITELAIKQQLLSHVGKTPEVTMGSRLVQEVQRSEDTTAIVRTRPGVYALRIWETEPPVAPAPAEDAAEETDGDSSRRGRRRRRRRGGDGDSGRTGNPEAARPEAKAEGGGESKSDGPLNPFDLYAGGSIYAEEEDEEVAARSAEKAKANEAAEAAEAEKNDDGAQASSDDDRSSSRRRGRSRRRRRRRDDERDGERSEESKSSSSSSSSDDDESARRPKKSSGRRSGRNSGRKRGRSRDRGPVSPAVAALRVLRDGGEAVDSATLTRDVGITGDGEAIAAALVTDNQVRESRGLRPFFVKNESGKWGLTEWKIDRGTLKAEQRLHDAAREMRRDAVDSLAKTLTTFGVDTWQHLVLALLKHMSYNIVGTTKREDGTIVVRAEHRVGLTSVFVAVELHEGDELGAEAVTELRGTLHHHESSRGVIFTTGYVAEEALAESRIANLAPITLIGRKHLAEMLLGAGIGVHELSVPVYYVDHGFFDRLKG